MAKIYGDDWDNDIDGSDYSDIIYGYDGDDLIYGYYGHDDIYGGYDHDTIYGGGGDDYLNGSAGSDDLYGGSGHDDLLGGSGHDDLFGGSGLDYLYGGTGDDLLVGGSGRDTLKGGSGEDIFVFTKGSSGITTSRADVITDWNRSDDWIDMSIKGTRSNYREKATSATSMTAAADVADYYYGDTGVRHVFLYNSRKDTGFLLSDLNGDGLFETGVTLKNAGYSSDMSYLYII